MKLKSLLLGAIIAFGFSANAQTSVYKQAGIIKIKDHEAIVAGTIRDDKDVFSISLMDIGKFDGHICGCNTAGFLITKNVLEKLYPNSIPMRHSMKVTISEYNRDMIDAIAFVTGARMNTSQYTKQGEEMIVDPSLAGKKGTTVLVFERKDNGKKIQVVLDKSFLLTQKEMMSIMTIKPKIMAKKATKAELAEFAQVTRDVIVKEITNMPKNAIVYKELN